MLKGVKLRWYQQQILDELSCVPAIGLFMKTGSGKTITSLARVDQNPTEHLLIICPQKIVSQWWEVLEKHTDFAVCRYNINWSAKKKDDFINDFLLKDYVKNKCVVVNFDIIQKMECLDWAVDEDWTIIVDESHKFKNMCTYKRDELGRASCRERVLRLV